MRPELLKLLYDMRAAANDVTTFAAGRSFDDFLHGYAQVDHAKTWDIVQTELPVLRRELEVLLGEGP